MRAARTWRGYPIPPSKSFHPSSYGYTASQQRNQQSRQRLRQQVAAPKVTGPVLIGPPGTPGVPSVKSGGPHFVLQHIVFTPSRFLTKAELNKLAAGYLHRSITLADLYALVTKINALYAKRELITDRAFLPPQHITHGQVTIQLVEGRVGRIELHGQPYTRRAFLLARLPVHRGQVLDAPALKDALEYFNRTNSLGLRAQLRPGESFGLSDVLLNVLEPPRYQLNVLANNEGAASTGRGQLGLYGVFNGPLRRGDSLSLYYMRSRGAYNYDVQYSVPLDTHGLKLSLSASHDNIHIIAGPYEALEIRGSGDQQGVTLSQALLVNRRWRLGIAASFEGTRSHTTIGGLNLSDTRTLQPALGLSAVYTPRHQRWKATVTFSRPTVRKTSGQTVHYWLYNATVNGRIALPFKGWAVGVQSTGQYSTVKSLTSSQLYQLGGPGTVLGYPSGAVAGVSGYFTELAVHRRLPHGLDGKLFYGRGSVHTWQQPIETLESVGIGIAGSLPGYGHLGRSAWAVSVVHPMRTVIPHQDAWTAYFHIIAPLNF